MAKTEKLPPSTDVLIKRLRKLAKALEQCVGKASAVLCRQAADRLTDLKDGRGRDAEL